MIELRHLRYFTVLAQEMNFRKAAVRLNIVQPALSQNMRQLEEALQTRLFARQGRGFILTPAGKALQQEAAISLKQLEKSLATVQRTARGEEGELRIAASGASMLGPVPSTVRRFRKRYPRIKIVFRELASDEMFRSLASEQSDIAFVYSEVDTRAFDIRMYNPEPLRVALPSRHRLATHHSISLAELRGESFVIPMRLTTPGIYDTVMAACAEAGFAPVEIQEISTAQNALSLVAAGFGVSLLPACVSAIQHEGTTLRSLSPQGIEVRLRAAWRRENSSAPLKHLIEML